MNAADIAIVAIAGAVIIPILGNMALTLLARLWPGDHRPWMCRVGVHVPDPSPRYGGCGWRAVRCPACGAEDIA